MRYEKNIKRGGFTLIELMVTIVISTIALLGVGFVLVDSQQGWNRMYNRVHRGVVADAYVARTAFDSAVRKSSAKRYTLGISSVEVYHYESLNSTELDKYAKFYVAAGQLLAEYGDYDEATGSTSATAMRTLAENVESCDFYVDASVTMVLVLTDGDRTMKVMSSAIRHNE